ncbi:unnamed protein product, partial [Meganyctiphanes norvegica]
MCFTNFISSNDMCEWLQQIELALQSANSSDKNQLQELQANLLQLLELTLQQLTEQQKTSNTSQLSANSNSSQNASHSERKKGNSSKQSSDPFDDEFSRFQLEIAELSSEQSSKDKLNDHERKSSIDCEDDSAKKIVDELRNLEGSHCRAPFTENWGGHSYHNALVLSVVTDETGHVDLDNPQIKVLFTQPTSLKMLPCRFYLNGRCNFSEAACKFSHGYVVSVSDIKDFSEPVYNEIVSGSRVLARHSDDLWGSATVEDVLEDHSAYSIKFDQSSDVVEMKPKPSDMIPLLAGEEHSLDHEENEGKYNISKLSNDDDEDDSDVETAVFVPQATWLANSMSQRLGEWEKYTKGIGSKLMIKMGYVIGTGLGSDGSGRVEPVEAYVYPKGVSLDHCMELKEAGNGDNPIQVEKRLEKQRKKEEAKSKRSEELLKERTSVFDIINKKLGGKGQGVNQIEEETPKKKLSVCKTVLKKDSSKELNKKDLQLSGSIRLLEKEINKMTETRSRNDHDKNMLKRIDEKILSKKNELKSLKEAERKVQGEQQNRKDTKKFCVF